MLLVQLHALGHFESVVFMNNPELAAECEILKPALLTMATLQSNVRWACDAQDLWQPVDEHN